MFLSIIKWSYPNLGGDKIITWSVDLKVTDKILKEIVTLVEKSKKQEPNSPPRGSPFLEKRTLIRMTRNFKKSKKYIVDKKNQKNVELEKWKN